MKYVWLYTRIIWSQKYKFWKFRYLLHNSIEYRSTLMPNLFWNMLLNYQILSQYEQKNMKSWNQRIYILRSNEFKFNYKIKRVQKMIKAMKFSKINFTNFGKTKYLFKRLISDLIIQISVQLHYLKSNYSLY